MYNKSMGSDVKVLEKILSGLADASFSFADVTRLLIRLGFSERIKGDHHIFYKEGVQEIINLQPKSGKAKPYQVRQIRSMILKYQIGGDDV